MGILENNKKKAVMFSPSKHGGQEHFLCMLVFVFGLCLSENTLAQIKNDSLNDRVVYVVNGVPVSKDKVNNNDILIKSVLKASSIPATTFEKEIDSAIAIITKTYAITEYQKKFSVFSRKYKDYLETHQNNDDDFLYVLDGVQLEGNRNDIIKTLYEIPFKNIE